MLPKKFADAVAISAATANTVICAMLVYLSRADTLVYWFGNWKPRGGIALGISFTVDPIGAGMAIEREAASSLSAGGRRQRCNATGAEAAPGAGAVPPGPRRPRDISAARLRRG